LLNIFYAGMPSAYIVHVNLQISVNEQLSNYFYCEPLFYSNSPIGRRGKREK